MEFKLSFIFPLHEYKVVLMHIEKLKEEALKILALAHEFKRMEEEQKTIHAEEERMHKPSNIVITNVMTETLKTRKLADMVVMIVEVELVGLAMKLTPAFFWFKLDQSELKSFEENEVWECSGLRGGARCCFLMIKTKLGNCCLLYLQWFLIEGTTFCRRRFTTLHIRRKRCFRSRRKIGKFYKTMWELFLA